MLAEHLGCDSAELEATIAETGRVRFALDALNPSSGRGLKFLELGKDRGIGAFLADTRLLDPRFEKGASARPRISGRHIGLGAVVLAVLALIFAAFAS